MTLRDRELLAHGVREQVLRLTGLGADLLARAQELDRRTIDGVIDQDQLGQSS